MTTSQFKPVPLLGGAFELTMPAAMLFKKLGAKLGVAFR